MEGEQEQEMSESRAQDEHYSINIERILERLASSDTYIQRELLIILSSTYGIDIATVLQHLPSPDQGEGEDRDT